MHKHLSTGKKKLLSFFSGILWFLPLFLGEKLAKVANAQIISDVGEELKKSATNSKCFGPFCYTDIGCMVANGLQWGLIIASLLLIAYLIIGGIQWMASSGDKGGLEAAKGRITAAVIGLVIVVAAYAIFLILRTTLGLPVGIDGKCNFTNTQKPSAGGGVGKTSPSGSSAWTCNKYPCDCCNVYANENAKKCCEQVGALTSCVVARYKNSDVECRKEFYIDFNCWRENYGRLVNTGKLNPEQDLCDTGR